jgi:hypothetical protein
MLDDGQVASEGSQAQRGAAVAIVRLDVGTPGVDFINHVQPYFTRKRNQGQIRF